MSKHRDEVVARANQLMGALEPDYCPNGLQVEGRDSVTKIVTGVTASQRFLEAAIAAEADLLLVHHGYFWKGESSPITGMKKARIAALIKADVSLLVYHLPLDRHPELGNNAQFGARLGFDSVSAIDPNDPGCLIFGVQLEQPESLTQLTRRVADATEREPLVISGGEHQIRRVCWCTGAAQGYIEQAVEAGYDAFISGEISESTVHQARELGIHYLSAGHHATEKYGVQALGQALADQLGLEHQFIDIDNPV